MNQLKFTCNYNNKLACNCFSSIRLYNPNKFIPGEVFEIVLQEKPLKKCRLIAVSNFLLENLNEFMARIDTGYGKIECTEMIKKMYHRYVTDWNIQKLSFILLETIK